MTTWIENTISIYIKLKLYNWNVYLKAPQRTKYKHSNPTPPETNQDTNISVNQNPALRPRQTGHKHRTFVSESRAIIRNQQRMGTVGTKATRVLSNKRTTWDQLTANCVLWYSVNGIVKEANWNKLEDWNT